MPDKLSLSKTFRALEDAISIAQQRHTIISSNISNLDTPNYRAKEIDFKASLARAMGSAPEIPLVKTDPGHIDFKMNSSYRAEPFEEEGEWNGYNWVDVDKEMKKMVSPRPIRFS